jgi:hypothetical protein
MLHVAETHSLIHSCTTKDLLSIDPIKTIELPKTRFLMLNEKSIVLEEAPFVLPT